MVEKYAFWSYDLFPYILWGKIEKTHIDRTVSVVGYDGFRFRPEFTLDPEAAENLIKQIKILVDHRWNSLKMYDKQIADLCKPYKIVEKIIDEAQISLPAKNRAKVKKSNKV